MVYDDLPDIHYMITYRANEGNYGLFPPNILYCCHKLNDIYLVYCIARSNLYYLDNNDFGDFANSNDSTKYVKFQLILSALHYYNILIDLSWQLIWFYIRTDLNKSILTKETFENVAKECNYDILRYNLALGKKNKLKSFYLESFFKTKQTQAIRKKWNYTKHRGTYYFHGLGMNDSTMMGKVNDLYIPLVSRPELDLEILKDELMNFDKEYFYYLSNLIKVIFPTNFTNENNLLSSLTTYYMNNKEELHEWNRKNSS